MKNKLYILLHCETCYNRKGIFCGRTDVDLTDVGHEHAEEVANNFKDIDLAEAYASPLARSQQTLAHVIRHHPETKVIIDERIIERDYGELTHLVKSEYKKEHPDLYPIYHRSYDVPPPGGESIEQVEKRVLPFLKEIIDKIKKEKINILIVTHGNAIRPMRRYMEDLTVDEMMGLESQRDVVFEYGV